MKIRFMMIFVYAFKTLTKFYFNQIRSCQDFFIDFFKCRVVFLRSK